MMVRLLFVKRRVFTENLFTFIPCLLLRGEEFEGTEERKGGPSSLLPDSNYVWMRESKVLAYNTFLGVVGCCRAPCCARLALAAASGCILR